MQAMPNWLTTVLLAMLLTVLTWKLSIRGFLTWRKETAASEKERDSEAAEPLLQNSVGEHSSHQHEALHSAFRSNGEPSLHCQTPRVAALSISDCVVAPGCSDMPVSCTARASFQDCMKIEDDLHSRLPTCSCDMGVMQAPRSPLRSSRMGGG